MTTPLSLLTRTAAEGRHLAIQLARASIHEMQSDAEIKKEIRKSYARSGTDLISAGRTIAIEFQTIAAANDYWRR